jgi:ankyrin repeat protein
MLSVRYGDLDFNYHNNFSLQLRVEEVQELLKVKLSSSEAISGPEEDIEDVLTTCGDFITVITSILNDGSLAPEIRRLIPRHVRLSQHPVRQVLLENYFRAEAETAGLAPEQYLHLLVSKACLSYLDGMEGFVGPADSQKYPLANYTARYWAWHLLQSGVTGYHNDPSMEGLVDRLFKWDSKQYFNWLQLYSIEPPSGGMESPLFRASYLGLEEIVQIALDRPERQHPNGLSSVGFVDPLGAAAGRGFREIVEILLIAGSKYGILDQHLVIPLVLAAEFNQKECVRTLLEFLCSRYFSTAGARQSQTAINTVLLKTGANLDLTRSTMRDLNPIKVATLKGFTPIVEMLLPHCDDKVAMAGLEVAACNKSKSLIEVYTSRFPNECMSYAAGLNWTEMVASLFQNGPSPKGTIHPASALQAAAYLGDEILVHSLLNAARPAKVNGFYSDAFHAAVAKGRLGSLKLLVGRGAKYSSQSRPAMRANSLACLGSAIQTASFYGHAEVVSYLLELDNINISAEQYLSAFQYAISQGHAEIVKILCPEYIDPKAYIQYDGILATSLSCAVRDNNMEIVKLLLKRGADINATSGLLADSKHYPKERWERRSQARETALELAAALGYVEIVELLFRNGADINRLGGARNGGEAGSGEPGDDRWRALHCAAYNCQLEVLKFLPKGKANISFRLLDSSTALHTAVSSHSPPWMIVECINILLEVGVHINAMDSAGKTALHLAGDRAQIVEHLIESEADPKIKDYKGMTIRQCIALASLKEKYSAGEQFMRWGEVAMVLGEMQIDSLVIRRRLGITQV